VKLGQVLEFKITPTRTSWTVVVTHRIAGGDMVCIETERAKLEGVLAYVKEIYVTHGAER